MAWLPEAEYAFRDPRVVCCDSAHPTVTAEPTMPSCDPLSFRGLHDLTLISPPIHNSRTGFRPIYGVKVTLLHSVQLLWRLYVSYMIESMERSQHC